MKKFIWTRHVAGDSVDGIIQRCVICGYEICNYENAMVETKHINDPLPFWNSGDLYVGGKNPQITRNTMPEDADDEIIDCKCNYL